MGVVLLAIACTSPDVSDDATSGSTSTSGAAVGTTTNSSSSSGQAPHAQPECDPDHWCQHVDDCCNNCGAFPADAVPYCAEKTCAQKACAARGLIPDSPNCNIGRCVEFSCQASGVSCSNPEPSCPPGETAAVDWDAHCWSGGCVPVTQCHHIECSKCDAATQVCVVLNVNGWSQCIDIPPACNGKATCDCMGSTVCVGVFSECKAFDAGLTCNADVSG